NISFSAWLYKIATNQINQYFRKGKYKSASLDELQDLHLCILRNWKTTGSGWWKIRLPRCARGNPSARVPCRNRINTHRGVPIGERAVPNGESYIEQGFTTVNPWLFWG